MKLSARASPKAGHFFVDSRFLRPRFSPIQGPRSHTSRSPSSPAPVSARTSVRFRLRRPAPMRLHAGVRSQARDLHRRRGMPSLPAPHGVVRSGFRSSRFRAPAGSPSHQTPARWLVSAVQVRAPAVVAVSECHIALRPACTRGRVVVTFPQVRCVSQRRHHVAPCRGPSHPALHVTDRRTMPRPEHHDPRAPQPRESDACDTRTGAQNSRPARKEGSRAPQPAPNRHLHSTCHDTTHPATSRHDTRPTAPEHANLPEVNPARTQRPTPPRSARERSDRANDRPTTERPTDPCGRSPTGKGGREGRREGVSSLTMGPSGHSGCSQSAAPLAHLACISDPKRCRARTGSGCRPRCSLALAVRLAPWRQLGTTMISN